jgi:hypothetical protein
MKNLKYKVLVHAGVFVEERLLYKGIYTAAVPTLYPHNSNLEDLRDRMIDFYKIAGLPNLDIALENLSKCELQKIELNFIDEA